MLAESAAKVPEPGHPEVAEGLTAELPAAGRRSPGAPLTAATGVAEGLAAAVAGRRSSAEPQTAARELAGRVAEHNPE